MLSWIGERKCPPLQQQASTQLYSANPASGPPASPLRQLGDVHEMGELAPSFPRWRSLRCLGVLPGGCWVSLGCLGTKTGIAAVATWVKPEWDALCFDGYRADPEPSARAEWGKPQP